MEENEAIKSFTQLEAWKEGHLLVLRVYSVSRTFPKEEIYGLTSQMRRCAVSITSNIAEGFGRRSFAEKAQFYSIALGSLTELHNQLMIARDIAYCQQDIFSSIERQLIQASKLINGLIVKSRTFIP